MDLLQNGWFSELSEEMWPGQSFSLRVKKVLQKEKSQFQDLLVVDTTNHGRALVLDGVIQCTEFDEFAYQEMISFLPLCAHTNPEKVLIIGGGDGGVAREVNRHPLVKEIVQVEIDDKVVTACKEHLPFMAVGFESEKLTLNIGDGFKYMQDHKNAFDVIITDSSDPIGPAANLFTESYFELLKGALKPHGIISMQIGSYWIQWEATRETIRHCKKHFRTVHPAAASVPTYPTGQITLLIAALDDCNVTLPKNNLGEKAAEEVKYYNAEVHSAAFVLPNFVKKELEKIV